MILLEFPQSHYCEKVRWALDYKGLSWQSQRLIPGLHRFTAKKYVSGTSLPILLDEGTFLQGSHEITSYLDQKYPQNMLGPADKNKLSDWIKLEGEIDTKVGIPLVSMIYYWLFQNPNLITYYFMNGLPIWQRLLFRTSVPILSARAKKLMALDETSYLANRKSFEQGLTWLESMITSNGFVDSSAFSRLDICAATALAPLCRPVEHPYQWPNAYRPKEVLGFYEEYYCRPGFQWMLEIYKNYRQKQSEPSL